MGETQVFPNMITISYFHQTLIGKKKCNTNLEINLAYSKKVIAGKSPKMFGG